MMVTNGEPTIPGLALLYAPRALAVIAGDARLALAPCEITYNSLRSPYAARGGGGGGAGRAGDRRVCLPRPGLAVRRDGEGGVRSVAGGPSDLPTGRRDARLLTFAPLFRGPGRRTSGYHQRPAGHSDRQRRLSGGAARALGSDGAGRGAGGHGRPQPGRVHGAGGGRFARLLRRRPPGARARAADEGERRVS